MLAGRLRKCTTLAHCLNAVVCPLTGLTASQLLLLLLLLLLLAALWNCGRNVARNDWILSFLCLASSCTE